MNSNNGKLVYIKKRIEINVNSQNLLITASSRKQFLFKAGNSWCRSDLHGERISAVGRKIMKCHFTLFGL